MPRPRHTLSRQELTDAQDQFVQAWGQLGPSWGISRTLAEVHALLYIAGRPMNTDEVMDRLHISRGNASMSLRSLLEWGLISRVHKRGDRKEYFSAEQDAWTIARLIIRERLRREILPTLTTLHDIRDHTRPDAQPDGPLPAGRSEVARPLAVTAPAADALPDIDPPTPQELAQHNDRLDALLELVTTVDKLAERFVGSEGKGLKLAASLLSKII
jgi:DNA-binding transcriptional regulator GbsR (MarR family)